MLTVYEKKVKYVLLSVMERYRVEIRDGQCTVYSRIKIFVLVFLKYSNYSRYCDL